VKVNWGSFGGWLWLLKDFLTYACLVSVSAEHKVVSAFLLIVY